MEMAIIRWISNVSLIQRYEGGRDAFHALMHLLWTTCLLYTQRLRKAFLILNKAENFAICIFQHWIPDKYSAPYPTSHRFSFSLTIKWNLCQINDKGAGSQLELWKHFSFFIIKLLARINWVSNQHVEVEMNIKEMMTCFV